MCTTAANIARAANRAFGIALATALLAAAVPVSSAPRHVVVGTWNIEHLAAHDGRGCRPRSAAEYQAMQRYVQHVGADVVAFQEVENKAAALRVFSPETYEIHISSRPSQDLGDCYDIGNRRLMQRTGFAVRKDLASRTGLGAVRQADVEGLGPGGSSRWGVHLVLESRDSTVADVHLLSVHLKSGCQYDPFASERAACRVLAGQVPPLKRWLLDRNRAGQHFIVLGDFNRQLDQLGDDLWTQLEGRNSGVAIDLEKARHALAHPRPYNPRFPYAIDHIVYNRAVDGALLETSAHFDVDAAAHSDHLPLFTTFDVHRLPAKAAAG